MQRRKRLRRLGVDESNPADGGHEDANPPPAVGIGGYG